MFFISSKKLFWFSRYSNFSDCLPNFPNSQGQIGSEIIYDVIKGLHKFEGVIFGIIKEPLYITSSNLDNI